MWLFDTRCTTWSRLELGRNFRYRSMASCINNKEKLYIFGGLHSYNSVLKDLVEISVDPNDLASPRITSIACIKCHEREKFPIC
jgi:N-acetylneuraminic acid mutarotase